VKVWIVLRHGWEDSAVAAVFSSQADAEAMAASATSATKNHEYEVEEWEVV
jgi:hypothetical protein